MNAVPLPPPTWISEPSEFMDLVSMLRRQPLVAVDTESNSLYVYKEQVCLIQFSTPDHDYLVDPLALEDISDLNEIFSSKSIEKIFHAAEYDIICLKRDFRFSFNNIFDTMHAARILGRSEVGLGGMLKSEFGILLEKRFQRANWGERPLSQPMLSYARMDTHFLIKLRNNLRKELEQVGLLDLAEEDFARLSNVNVPDSDNDNQNCWKMVGRKSLSVKQCAVLQSLIEYRDLNARRANLPHFKILGNQTLIDIARACPTNLTELTEATRISARQLERHGHGLLQAVAKGSTNTPPPRPANTRPSDAILDRMDKLKEWRKETARKLKVESDVVLPKDIAEHIAFANPSSLLQLNKIMNTTPWRYKQYGQKILEVINKSEKS